MWPVTLSGRLPVVALVSRYLTNKLIGREPIYNHYITLSTNTPCGDRSYPVLDPVSQAYPEVQGRSPTCYSPVRHSSISEETFPFDLHVLSTPPAFVLSQDQTLQTKPKHSLWKREPKVFRNILTKQTATPPTTGHQEHGQK